MYKSLTNIFMSEQKISSQDLSKGPAAAGGERILQDLDTRTSGPKSFHKGTSKTWHLQDLHARTPEKEPWSLLFPHEPLSVHTQLGEPSRYVMYMIEISWDIAGTGLVHNALLDWEL